MPTVLTSIALLACPIGMGLMMMFMMRGHKTGEPGTPSPNDASQVETLRAEIAELKAQHGQADAVSWR